MNTWKVILATLVIFGTGVVTGGLLVSVSQRMIHSAQTPLEPEHTNSFRDPARASRPATRGNPLPAPMPGPLRKDFLDRLQNELQLTTAQRERIERIITRGQERTREVWQRIEPDVRRQMIETRAQIRRELTSDQQARFEDFMRRPRDQRRVNPADASNTPGRKD